MLYRSRQGPARELATSIQPTMLLRTTLRTRALPLRPVVRLTARRVSSAPLISIQDGTFYRQFPSEDDKASNPPLYPNFNFTLPSDTPASKRKAQPEHWAVIGTPSRTELLHILRGQHICIPPTARSYPYLLSDEIAAKDHRLRFVGNAVQYIGFSGEGSGAIGGTRGAYLSARYESHREETDWTVEQFLRGQTSLNPAQGEEKGIIHDEELFQEVVADLHLSTLLDMPVANLSNGQTRRARIAKALLRKPELLLLDEPFMGLDPATVRSISGLLYRLAKKSSPRLILALRPQDTLPKWITHIIVVGHSNTVLAQGPRSDVTKILNIWSGNEDKSIAPRATIRTLARQDLKKHMESGALDDALIHDFQSLMENPKVKQYDDTLHGEPLLEMEGVRVQYGDKVVLGDWQQKVNNETQDGLHWRVRRGQRWAILGANGSGKTTLLSLITSDHPQAYAQPIKLFGRCRLPEVGKPGISLFELQSRMGHSSPEIHAFFPRQLTVREALESAFAETFLSKPVLDAERDLDVNAVLRFFRPELDPNWSGAEEPPPAISTNTKKLLPKLHRNQYNKRDYVPPDHGLDYADSTRFGQLTIAQQRIVLFLRAFIHKPDIVILDEPFSGLTPSQRDKCLHFIELGERPKPGRAPEGTRLLGLSKDQALLFISHVKEEIPDCVRYYMRLPYDSADGSEPLDFRFGTLNKEHALRQQHVWDVAWSGASQFEADSRRSRRPPGDPTDMDVYQWHSI